MVANPVSTFISEYVAAIHDQNAAVFAGAGLSIPAGFVDWKGLLRNIASDVGLDVDRETDLVAVAQYHLNEHGSRHKLNQALVSEFSGRARLTKNHEILASLPIRTYWTTNYDTLIEEALKAAGKTPDVKSTPASLTTTAPKRDAIVYKMHGDVSQPDKAVVTRDDYEQYGRERSLFSTALQGDLVSKTFLFVGFSFSDPNLEHVMSRVRVLLGQNVRTHYCLVRRVQRKDFATAKQAAYATAKQDLQLRDLKRYGIIGILVDDYKEYTTILSRVAQTFRRSRVFISGSAADYAPWSEDSAQLLIHEIARRLTLAGFSLVSGAGLGVGTHMINGLLDALNRENTRVLTERLILRPFPLAITDASERTRRWREYRHQIIAEAGIAVFLFGNKRDSTGAVIDAAGVREEFKIAVAKQLPVVPVGCTGGVSASLHDTVSKDLGAYFPAKGYKAMFADLGKTGSPATVAARVVAVVKKLRDEPFTE
jgi:hypothetical protein